MDFREGHGRPRRRIRADPNVREPSLAPASPASPPAPSEKYRVARNSCKRLASARESVFEGEGARVSAAAELLHSGFDRAGDRRWDLEFAACARDIVPSGRAQRG